VILIVKKGYSFRPWRFVDHDGREISRTVTRYHPYLPPARSGAFSYEEPFCRGIVIDLKDLS
jgi:hypothetical protein